MTIINYYKTDFEKFLETIKTKTKENAIKALETLDQSRLPVSFVPKDVRQQNHQLIG